MYFHLFRSESLLPVAATVRLEKENAYLFRRRFQTTRNFSLEGMTSGVGISRVFKENTLFRGGKNGIKEF
ncbi:MAG TPA: hypothetical protein PK878_13315 [bacterium]|nr:hypothetical protein [Candidatus Omnitrophota bacterium]HOJ61258.1 hypothetical protein [bacterium]HPP00564.1 hypothetical protein [bacterium]HXK94953.1 hypothetical protein [bacterium]